MKQNKKVIFLFFAFSIIATCKIHALNWPIYVYPYQQHPITGTLGEYRASTRFHQGVDIAEPDGTHVAHVGSTIVLGDKGTNWDSDSDCVMVSRDGVARDGVGLEIFKFI